MTRKKQSGTQTSRPGNCANLGFEEKLWTTADKRSVASSDQERTLIDRIKQMERFRAVYFCEGKKKPSSVSLRP